MKTFIVLFYISLTTDLPEKTIWHHEKNGECWGQITGGYTENDIYPSYKLFSDSLKAVKFSAKNNGKIHTLIN